MVSGNDLVLLLEIIGLSGSITGRKRLQKIVCILKHRNHLPLGFNYIPYYYGPYSDELASAIQTLIGSEYVNEEAEEIGIGIYQYTYTLTTQGQAIVNEITEQNLQVENIDPNHLRGLLNEINQIDTPELVRISKQLNLETEIVA